MLTPVHPNSDVVVFPIGIAPAPRSRSTNGVSAAALASELVFDPARVGIPRTSARSFTVTGNPCSRPSGADPITAFSAARAPAMAPSASRNAIAFNRGSSRSTRSSTACITSTGEACLRRIIGANSWAGRVAKVRVGSSKTQP